MNRRKEGGREEEKREKKTILSIYAPNIDDFHFIKTNPQTLLDKRQQFLSLLGTKILNRFSSDLIVR
jgi:hypothetical protein